MRHVSHISTMCNYEKRIQLLHNLLYRIHTRKYNNTTLYFFVNLKIVNLKQHSIQYLIKEGV